MSIIQIFTNQVADGNSTLVPLPKNDNPAANLPAIDVTLFGSGTFGGGTLALEATPDGATWVPVQGASLTAAGAVSARVVARQVRAALSGATAPNLNAWAGFGGGLA